MHLLLILALLSTEVGIRVDEYRKDIIIARPIYPARLGLFQTKGTPPKKGELLTCSPKTGYVETDKFGNLITKIILECRNGREFEVMGIELQ